MKNIAVLIQRKTCFAYRSSCFAKPNIFRNKFLLFDFDELNKQTQTSEHYFLSMSFVSCEKVELFFQ